MSALLCCDISRAFKIFFLPDLCVDMAELRQLVSKCSIMAFDMCCSGATRFGWALPNGETAVALVMDEPGLIFALAVA